MKELRARCQPSASAGFEGDGKVSGGCLEIEEEAEARAWWSQRRSGQTLPCRPLPGGRRLWCGSENAICMGVPGSSRLGLPHPALPEIDDFGALLATTD